MGEAARKLAEKLGAFYAEVTAFVENCTAADWSKVCPAEEWTVGVTARHIAAGHFEAVGLARLMVQGEKLPEITMDQLAGMANEHARRHAGCTKAEVLEILRRNGAALVDFVAGLSDDELGRRGHLALAGGELTARQLLEAVILRSGGEHLAHMRAAVEA